MGAKASTASGNAGSRVATSPAAETRSRTLSTSNGTADAEGSSSIGLLRSASHGGGHGNSRDRNGDRGRTQSLSGVPGQSNGAALSIPALLSGATNGGARASGGGSETEGSSPEDFIGENPFSYLNLRRVLATHSFPNHLWSFNGFKCPICSKVVLSDDIECHLVLCLTKPLITYNEDVLKEDKGECVICFEDLTQGDTIARLPCLCIYHKACIDQWFQVNRSCPEHPSD